MAGMGVFRKFLLGHTDRAWDVYDAHGNLEMLCSSVAEEFKLERCQSVKVDRQTLVDDADTVMFRDSLTLVACAEYHVNASAADHCNFLIMCHKMLITASPSDLEHVCTIDSRRYDCRVTGLMVDLPRLSKEAQDMYLDRVSWLNNSWPLAKENHLDNLASRLARVRSGFVSELLRQCGEIINTPNEIIVAVSAKWSLLPPGEKVRVARFIIDELAAGILFLPCAAEQFDVAVVEEKASRIIRGLRNIL